MLRKTALHCFGRHVETVGADKIMWGDPPDRLGQITYCLYLIWRQIIALPALFTFGTGASEKDDVKEAEYWIRFMWENLDSVRGFTAFKEVDVAQMRLQLGFIEIYPETTSMNTIDEVKAIGELYLARGIAEATFVTCPTHASRCMREVLQAWSEPRFDTLRRGTSVRASDVNYIGYNVGDVSILEPPHRPDDKLPSFFRMLPEVFRLSQEDKQTLYHVWSDMLGRMRR